MARQKIKIEPSNIVVEMLSRETTEKLRAMAINQKLFGAATAKRAELIIRIAVGIASDVDPECRKDLRKLVRMAHRENPQKATKLATKRHTKAAPVIENPILPFESTVVVA